MKKITSSLFLILLISAASAQTKTANKLGTSSKLSKNDSIMCSKIWHVSSVEKEGAAARPTEKHENDLLAMRLDNTYNLIIEGAKKAGKWSRSGQYIYFTDESSGQKFNYKVLVVDPKKIKVEYANAEVKTIFEMEPK
jgi:hypothetical protein